MTFPPMQREGIAVAINRVRSGGISLFAGVALAASVLAGCGTVAAPKTAGDTNAFCTGTGVNVVVDFGAMGGVKKGCGQGKTALAVFESAGFKMGTESSSYGPFVCTINALPADKKCDGKPAYWGLYVGKGTTWGYASLGVSSQPVSNGQTVALAWQTSSKSTNPSVPPVSK